jgi:alkyl sulfatase BDS1-like metallo-beta-lactamase superfamily hydrolase
VRGEYRWVAELVNHLVFADPANGEARALQADALEQMGYQAESGPWRAFYLTGAQELRSPRPGSETPRQGAAGQLRALPADALLDSLSVRLNGEKAGLAGDLALTLSFTDSGERFAVSVENAVLHHRPGERGPEVTLTRPVLIALVIGETTLDAALAEGKVRGPGADGLSQLLPLLDRFDFWFEIVAP